MDENSITDRERSMNLNLSFPQRSGWGAFLAPRTPNLKVGQNEVEVLICDVILERTLPLQVD